VEFQFAGFYAATGLGGVNHRINILARSVGKIAEDGFCWNDEAIHPGELGCIASLSGEVGNSRLLPGSQ
jgi:hypothetical protein